MKLWPDVSNNNGAPIDAAAAKAQGMAAICAKASEGLSYTDTLFAANYSAARAAGLPFMAYHFMHPGNGAAQAEFFANIVRQTCGGFKVGMMLDRERDLAGGVSSGADCDQFLVTLAALAPGRTICGYEAQWVEAAGGASAQMERIPLVWPNYVSGSGSPQHLVAEVTPGWFVPFGGHYTCAVRQYSMSAAVANMSSCDVNVCFDDATFAELFNQVGPVPPGTTAPPTPLIDAGGHVVNAAAVGMAVTPSGKGYWLVGADGGVFTYGDAAFYGSLGAVKLHAPIVGIAARPKGDGYWLAGADGGVFSFGKATFHGSMGGKPLARPITAIHATPSGLGYWLEAQDYGIFSFGDAHFEGSLTVAAPS